MMAVVDLTPQKRKNTSMSAAEVASHVCGRSRLTRGPTPRLHAVIVRSDSHSAHSHLLQLSLLDRLL